MKFIEITEIKKNERAGIVNHKKYIINSDHILFFTVGVGGGVDIKLTDGNFINGSIKFEALKKELNSGLK